MLHLSTDRLAALADEQPTPDEAAHLALCAACAEERMAFQTLVAMAHAERAPLGLPLTRWESIAAGLALDAAAAPTASSESGAQVTPIHRREVSPWARRSLQIAAGLLLVAGGAIAGRASVDRDPPPQSAVADAGARDASDSATSFVTVEEA